VRDKLSSESEFRNRKELSEIFKRSPRARFVPVREINYKDEFYLEKFVYKWQEIKTNETKLRKLLLYYSDLRSIYIDIALIVLRINQDGSKLNRSEELWEIIKEREGTSLEFDELESLRIFINYLNLDVKSLFIHILIFMDKLAKFLSSVIKAENLRNRSFDRFKKDLKKKRGKEIEEFSHLIYNKTEWFKKVKDIRDDFIEHHPSVSGGIGFRNGKAHATLTTTKSEDTIFEHIPIEEIDGILAKLKEFLKSLNEFLCSRIDVLPIKEEG